MPICGPGFSPPALRPLTAKKPGGVSVSPVHLPRAALLRGVNVGGAGRLPMDRFRDLLAGLGLERPETVIQSGNAVFGSALCDAALGPAIADAVAAAFGFRPEVFILDRAALAAALAHPFGDVPPEQVHAVFGQGTAEPDSRVIAALAAPSETWDWAPGLFRLHAPDGIGRSRLMARLPALLGGTTTARNLRTLHLVAGRMAARAQP